MNAPETKPGWEYARDACEALAAPLFKLWMRIPETSRAEDDVFDAWFRLRLLGSLIAANRSTGLTAREQLQLCGALQTAHMVRHDADFDPSASVSTLSVCKCEVADLAQELVALIEDLPEARLAKCAA